MCVGWAEAFCAHPKVTDGSVWKSGCGTGFLTRKKHVQGEEGENTYMLMHKHPQKKSRETWGKSFVMHAWSKFRSQELAALLSCYGLNDA